MKESRIEEIQEQMEEIKENRAKASGKIEEIEKRWEKDFDITTPAAAEKLSKKRAEEVETLKSKENELEAEIEELLEEMEE